MFRAAQTRSLDRHFLPVHHVVTGFFSPAVSTPRGMLLMPLPGQVPHFFLHHQAHQRQPGLAHQVAHAFLQQTHDLGHRKNHLKVGILFAGQLPEFLHRSLLVDLVSFLHSDSLLFLGRKNHPRPIMTADVRVATFYELTGILEFSLSYAYGPERQSKADAERDTNLSQLATPLVALRRGKYRNVYLAGKNGIRLKMREDAR